MHSLCPAQFHWTISCPAALSFASSSISTLSIGGCTFTTPSSTSTPMVSGLVWACSYMSCRQGIGVTLGSNTHGWASTTFCMTVTREERLLVIGPIAEGTCSCPSVDTGTPMYGSLELFATKLLARKSHHVSELRPTVGFRPQSPFM
jgi:hypothetical protein